MRKMRLILIFVTAVMLILTAMSCKKTTEPDADVPAGMVFIKGGTFTMGDTRNADNEYETPHKVTLSSFYIGKYEVTQAEYSKYMQPQIEWSERFGIGNEYPAYYVCWYEAIKYCNLRSIDEGLTPCYTIKGSTNPADWGEMPTGWEDPQMPIWDGALCNWKANGYRLPTGAEWEYAARGATNTPDYLYSGSNNIGEVAWYYENSNGSSHRVGTKAANGIGIYDMSGNIKEWCWDWEDFETYGSDPQTNPTGPEWGPLRLQRGGDWEYDGVGPEYCDVIRRHGDHPQDGRFISGFRVCRTK